MRYQRELSLKYKDFKNPHNFLMKWDIITTYLFGKLSLNFSFCLHGSKTTYRIT